MKRIVLTGGGTAGHVTPNIALIPRLKELHYDIQYIGSYNGIEKELISQFNIPYHGISSGKLRRYFNKMRTAKPGEIKNPRSYLYTTMRNTFDKWQNDILVAEKEDSDNNKK